MENPNVFKEASLETIKSLTKIVRDISEDLYITISKDSSLGSDRLIKLDLMEGEYIELIYSPTKVEKLDKTWIIRHRQKTGRKDRVGKDIWGIDWYILKDEKEVDLIKGFDEEGENIEGDDKVIKYNLIASSEGIKISETDLAKFTRYLETSFNNNREKNISKEKAIRLHTLIKSLFWETQRKKKLNIKVREMVIGLTDEEENMLFGDEVYFYDNNDGTYSIRFVPMSNGEGEVILTISPDNILVAKSRKFEEISISNEYLDSLIEILRVVVREI
ncbi:MAG: hypothetical protein COU06_00805 [Candidatus Harrisonbacteria bacterium CG10_big_fil_rev_8_21_14_0_10_38_8]|uniref:Uncharacterized protein n=1 Tax=Candidatus Harrisonbacteria bacterium CG10_big_fil_rev_8_21_14_0_10_38_8 TaxID=1974582 RepID=A0A2M6WKG7_9BACT|nr:MAG: hypothetical protein COU06_00805 [Candidatus Harrisonbacteria bacterium CG10_big_fil_rev_8_21_14_0_10_38_8]